MYVAPGLYCRSIMLVLPFLVSLALVQAQDNTDGSFIEPPATGAIHDYSQNPVYQIGQELNIQWNTSWKAIGLVLWQNDNNSPEVLLQNEPNNGSLSWRVATSKNYTAQTDNNGQVFYLQLSRAQGKKAAFGSHYFNITGPDGGSTSTAPSATATVAASAPTGQPASQTDGSSTASQTDGSSAASDSQPSSTGVTAQAKQSGNSGLAIGLGVALGLVFVAIVGAVAFLLWRRRQQRQAVNDKEDHQELAPPQPSGSPPRPSGPPPRPPRSPPSNEPPPGYYAPGEKSMASTAAAVEAADQRSAHSYSGVADGTFHEMPAAVPASVQGVREIREVEGVHELPVQVTTPRHGDFQ